MGDFFEFCGLFRKHQLYAKFALEISKKQRLKMEFMLKSFVSSNPILCWYWQI